MNFLKIEIENYLQMIKNSKSETTYTTYKNVLEEVIEYLKIENNCLNLNDYRMKIASQNRNTIAKKVSIFRNFVKFLENKGYNFRIIGDDEISVPNSLPKPLSIETIKKALKNADLVEYTAIITIFGLGLKISEATNILLENIKEEWIIIISRNNKNRNIPMEKHIKDTINKYIETYKPKKYLFEKNGVQMSDTKLRYIIEKAFKKIDVKMSPIQLRVTFINEMVKNGAKIKSVSKILGHNFIKTTEIFLELNSSVKLKNYLKAHPLCSHF